MSRVRVHTVRQEKTYVFPGADIVIVCVLRFNCGHVRYQSSFSVKGSGRFYGTSCQNIMITTFLMYQGDVVLG